MPKKQKTIKPFYFKNLSKEDMMEILNEEYPINLKYNAALINRIYSRYPFISKAQITIIVTGIFSSFRDFLVLGQILNLNKLFFDTKFLFFKHTKGSRIYPSLKTQVGTPPPLRKI